MLEQVKLLHEAQLYDDVKSLVSPCNMSKGPKIRIASPNMPNPFMH